MKTAKIIIAASVFALATSFTYAGPGAQYWNQRRAERARAAAAAPAEIAKATEACCRIVTVQRPVASHKVSIPVQSLKCDGCASMAAGEKCLMSDTLILFVTKAKCRPPIPSAADPHSARHNRGGTYVMRDFELKRVKQESHQSVQDPPSS